ncbi:gpW family head-tail joining protein [Nitratireductor sp. GCM10026969]|uniref:gpW family head-tail joining protein n=1 Tax=Nitratireductor sp. GCM10026969 TaxID=3252645 RepID=UPI00361C5989
MSLTPEQRAELEAQLKKARAALFKLETGAMTASITYEGESVTYRATSIGALRNFVRELEAKLGLRKSARARSRGVIF